MDAKTQQTLLAASMAGLVAIAGAASWFGTAIASHADEDGKVHCYGVNKCQGVGDCGGKGHSCAGQNACNGQAWLSLEEEDCLRIKDGRLTPEPEAE